MRAPYISAAIAVLLITNQSASETRAAQTGDPLVRAVESELREDQALHQLEVTAEGARVTLTGEVRTFWEKNEALRRTFGVDGVDTVVSEIDVPRADSAEQLAEDVVEAIQEYPHYRIWDLIEGGLDDGVVTLTGRVTPERDKSRELFERIAKVRGVQDVQITLDVLSANSQDRALRRAIFRRVFVSEHFERFASMNNPPFRIIVDHGVVTLAGYVQGEIERIEMERIVGQTQRVLRVENQLQTLQ